LNETAPEREKEGVYYRRGEERSITSDLRRKGLGGIEEETLTVGAWQTPRAVTSSGRARMPRVLLKGRKTRPKGRRSILNGEHLAIGKSKLKH